MILPIPKDSTKDQRVPLHYRGISLLSCISKLYSSFLNNRLLPYLEANDMLVDEQNGFRPNRSCQDHVYAANTIIKNRLQAKQATFVTYLDLQKAFDFLDRNALMYKLLSNGINGNFYNAIKSMYTDTSSCIRLNGVCTDWFNCSAGVRQGDNLSPTIFAFYINDLAVGLKNLNKGVDIDGENVCLLMYADDIMLMAGSESDMQDMLNYVNEWCSKWRLKVNPTKSNVVHFRNSGKQRSNYQFHVGVHNLSYADSYKYLGVVFNEFLDLNLTAETLSLSGGRALGSVISKIHNFKSVGIQTYTKLYNSCVVPVMDYCSGVWGFKQHSKADVVQNRAIRYFLGVHRFTPTLALNGEVGWVPCKTRRWVNILRLWNRLVKMNDSRITKKIFLYDYSFNNKSWCSDVKSILSFVNMEDIYRNKLTCDVNIIEKVLLSKHNETWLNGIHNVAKLRTYVTFKTEYCCENYVKRNLEKRERSFLAQFRCGILPLRIKIGRFVGQKPEDRICLYCSSNSIEDERHFLLK